MAKYDTLDGMRYDANDTAVHMSERKTDQEKLNKLKSQYGKMYKMKKEKSSKKTKTESVENTIPSAGQTFYDGVDEMPSQTGQEELTSVPDEIAGYADSLSVDFDSIPDFDDAAFAAFEEQDTFDAYDLDEAEEQLANKFCKR